MCEHCPDPSPEYLERADREGRLQPVEIHRLGRPRIRLVDGFAMPCRAMQGRVRIEGCSFIEPPLG